MKTGYKILTKYNNKLYSFLLGKYLMSRHFLTGIKNPKYFIEYSQKLTIGNPWIAVFNSKKNMFRFISDLEADWERYAYDFNFTYYKIEYVPFEENVIFMSYVDFTRILEGFELNNKRFKKGSLNKYFKHYDLNIKPPKGTVFAKEIKLIKEIPYEKKR